MNFRVSFIVAKKLQKLGYDLLTDFCYDKTRRTMENPFGYHNEFGTANHNVCGEDILSAPLFEDVKDWFSKNYDISYLSYRVPSTLFYTFDTWVGTNGMVYSSREACENAAILYIIEYINEFNLKTNYFSN